VQAMEAGSARANSAVERCEEAALRSSIQSGRSLIDVTQAFLVRQGFTNTAEFASSRSAISSSFLLDK
jgi:hypothetical protein